MKARYLFLSVLAATALPIPAADASVLLIFGQTGSADTVTGTRTLSSTTITSSAPVDITEIDAPLGIPISATFTLNAHSISAATTVGPAPDIVQSLRRLVQHYRWRHQLLERNVLRRNLRIG